MKFVVTLLSGAKITPCPLDDSLAVKMKKKDFTEVQAFANQYASSKMQDQLRQLKIAALSNKLVDDHKMVMPEWLLTSEAQYLVASAKVDWNALPKVDQDQYLKTAERTVKLAVILDKIRENEPETQLADQEVIEMIRNMLAKAGADVDQMMQEFSKSGQLVILSARIRDEFALDFLVKNTKWIE
jgi:FKBP-type peptidyl-prolyl cis-trans isomerase (trigger factor)